VSRSESHAGAAGDPRARRKLTRNDIEAKFRELQGDLTSAAEGARSKVIVIGGAAVAAVVVVTYLIGRRAGRKRSTVVEIRRL
jgi:hypothetical protein